MRIKLFQYSICVFAFSLSFNPDWSSKAILLAGIMALFNLRFDKNALRGKLLYFLLGLSVFTIFNLCIIAKSFDGSFLILVGLLFLFYFLFFHTRLESSWYKYFFISFTIGVYFVGFLNLGVALLYISDIDFMSLYNTWSNYSVIDIQKIYYALYLNMAFLFIIDLVIKNARRYRPIIITAICLATLLLFVYSGSLSGIGMFLVLCVLITVYYELPKYFHGVSAMFVLLPLVTFLALINPSAQKIFSKVDGENSRIRNFNVNKELVFQSPIIGYGLGKELETMQKAREPGSWEFKNKYHAHNQYFEFFLGGGMVLFAVFVYLFSLLLMSAYSNYSKSLYPIGFCIIMVFVFLIESILRRHHGFMFFTFFFMLFMGYLSNNNSVTLSKEIKRNSL
ncbi:O-antigen ligase family protein [Maribacter sp. MMG018]|uniref:O-antigen ligase family protein n=1 Tax=Maribacter sp. MMG018 TaxID=2822688 RepID=UPI001B36DBF5|nr:O-antigen ligase family protein [Maribacter sp. MMG018]MBQ4913421.1 O-antigen ligase family protein [Maribacter sp. MMG018]